jgi:hypothetical protein
MRAAATQRRPIGVDAVNTTGRPSVVFCQADKVSILSTAARRIFADFPASPRFPRLGQAPKTPNAASAPPPQWQIRFSIESHRAMFILVNTEGPLYTNVTNNEITQSGGAAGFRVVV